MTSEKQNNIPCDHSMRQYEKTTKLTAISEFHISHQKRLGHVFACFETETSSNRDT